MKNWLAKFWRHDKSFFTTFVPFMLLMCIVYCLIAAKISREAGERIGKAYVRMMREELMKLQETEDIRRWGYDNAKKFPEGWYTDADTKGCAQ